MCVCVCVREREREREREGEINSTTSNCRTHAETYIYIYIYIYVDTYIERFFPNKTNIYGCTELQNWVSKKLLNSSHSINLNKNFG